MIKEKIKTILEYLQDEENHFWENCNCSEEIQESQDINKCKCEENKKHIYRYIVDVDKWLDSPYCPLIDKEEYKAEVEE